MRTEIACVVLLACTACEVLSPPGGGAASIEIVASAETLSFTPDDGRTIALTAVPTRNVGAFALARGRVSWSSSDPMVEVTSDGGAAATLTWSAAGANAPAVVPVEITATIEGIVARRSIVACPVRQVAAKNSGTLLLGRNVTLVATAYGYAAAPSSPANQLAIAPRWTSSNPSVVSIDVTTASALSPGDALLTASACGATDTVSVRVASTGYSLSEIEIPGETSSWPVALNDSGQVVVYAGTPASHYVWKAGVATELADCHALDINNRAQVLCFTEGDGPVIWENGAASVRDTVRSRYGWINDAGHVAGVTPAGVPFIWKGPGTFTQLGSFAATLVAGMNERDDVVGTIAGQTHGDPVIWRNGTTLMQAHPGSYADGLALNDSADFAGSGDVRTCLGGLPAVAVVRIGSGSPGWELRRSSHCLANDVATHALGINNRREVVGVGSQGPFVWAKGRLTLLNDLVTNEDWSVTSVHDINERGQIVGIATNRRTNAVRAVLLDPP